MAMQSCKAYIMDTDHQSYNHTDGILGRTTVRLNSSLDYSDSQSSDTQQDPCTVYISYTDSKAHWVYDYLKPLIESWNSQVILHEEDMVPGYTISGERQRLIRGAHRVVLVVSEDYSSSPWCLYELQHAITQEPILFKGRIIPVMVDGEGNSTTS